MNPLIYCQLSITVIFKNIREVSNTQITNTVTLFDNYEFLQYCAQTKLSNVR